MLITPTEIKELKTRVKQECIRRAYAGNVSAYGSELYDYTNEPNQGVKISQEHYNKIAIPLNAINADVITTTDIGNTLIKQDDLLTMDVFVTSLETRSITDTSGGDCKASCTGMCYGCQTTCTGSCTNSCQGCTGCSGSCTGTCSGCSGTCSGGCDGGCMWSCWSCSGSCTGSCSSCSGSCTGSCIVSCTGACAVCSGGAGQ